MAEARVAVFRRKNYGVSFACDRCRNIFYFGRTREVSFSRVLANGRAKVLEYEITMSVGRLPKIEIQNRYTCSPPPTHTPNPIAVTSVFRSETFVRKILRPVWWSTPRNSRFEYVRVSFVFDGRPGITVSVQFKSS